jgi:hypothetical protein
MWAPFFISPTIALPPTPYISLLREGAANPENKGFACPGRAQLHLLQCVSLGWVDIVLNHQKIGASRLLTDDRPSIALEPGREPLNQRF